MKNKKEYIGVLSILLICLVSVLSSCSRVSKPNEKYYVAAYVWPSCHDESLSRDVFWDEGEGEWEVIKKGDSRFDGHYQPKRPLWGYRSDSDPKAVEKR